ncbi:EamA-like transporter family protein [Legionella massiliensis]|uniref:EamA-like transporter family protein n=1 Tax=Legionella massiliensis TaxID=1034943 RepID=A0A078KS69_9GAMM|nr:DMT family transporter [Legionella massiliensis]CDZ75817.1 EamA-like transporter family protein [Legionella massiliensis]CEE11555.1 EamA-like transporter family protein [Legionella massiliensis]
MWFVYAVLASILWGLNYTLAEKILDRISPISLITIEVWIGAILFTAISYFTTLKKDLAILASDHYILWLTIVEALVVLIAGFFIVASIHLKNATVAGIIELTYPLFIIFFTWFLFSEIHVNSSVIIGGLLIFLGVLIISLA